jgi:hypothetical protein
LARRNLHFDLADVKHIPDRAMSRLGTSLPRWESASLLQASREHEFASTLTARDYIGR